jgi:hypothetical protein
MVGHKGRDYTVQYMPAKKVHRWDAKLWVLAESDTGYTKERACIGIGIFFLKNFIYQVKNSANFMSRIMIWISPW